MEEERTGNYSVVWGTTTVQKSDDILNYYDLIMLVAEDGDVLQYECRFNGRKLKQTRVKRLITNYVKGLQILVQPELK